MQLNEIRSGENARIISVEPSDFKDKLMEMGCIPGTVIKRTVTAPLGDPLAFDIEGYCLSMRRTEAASIVVELIEGL